MTPFVAMVATILYQMLCKIKWCADAGKSQECNFST